MTTLQIARPSWPEGSEELGPGACRTLEPVSARRALETQPVIGPQPAPRVRKKTSKNQKRKNQVQSQ
jgi:hypothetical protein